MSSPRGILLLEGPDASGKSTLARFLVEKFNARLIHSTYHAPDKIWRWHLAALRLASKLADQHLVVMDRHWFSELAYGADRCWRAIGRKTPANNPIANRCFDRALMKAGALYVMCVPRDLKKLAQRHATKRGAGQEMFKQILPVAEVYRDLIDGNVAHPGDSYLDQLIRRGDFTRRPDVVTYDLDVDGRNLNRYADYLVERLNHVRGRQWPDLLRYDRDNFLGRAGTAKVAIVGDVVSPRHPGPTYPVWPFFAPDSDNGSTGYLNQALHSIKFDETTAAWVNANGPNGQEYLEWLTRFSKIKFVALGFNAYLATAKVVDRGRITGVHHPAWWKRFKYDDFAGYAEVLRRATM